MNRLFVIGALLLAGVAGADRRPEIAWSTSFTATTSSDIVYIVRFSETEPDMVYFAGVGTPISGFTDGNGDKYDAYPYTSILPSPDPVRPVDRGQGLFVGKMNYVTNSLEFLSFVKTDPKRVTELTDMDFDENGNIYLIGNISHYVGNFSALPQNLDMVGCHRGSPPAPDWDGVFVKLNPDATQILRSCYWGYDGDDKFHGIAVISDGDFIIVGETTSPDFLVNNEDQAVLNGTRDAFFAHFVNDASLLSASFIGGSAEEALLDITRTRTGRILASGITESTDFPTTAGAFQAASNGNFESIILELDLDRQGGEPNVQYATYLGGSGNESAQEIVEDGYGDIYIVGTSNSQDYPVVGAVANPPALQPGLVVTKFDDRLSRILFSTVEVHSTMTFWSGEAIAVSDEGDIVVTGQIDGIGFFPSLNRLLELDDAAYSMFTFNRDGYLFKWLNSSTGYTRDYTTLLAGGGFAKSVDIKSPGEVVVSGYTTSNAFVDQTYWTIPSSIMGDYHNGPYVMYITNDIPQRQLPGSGGGGGNSGGGGGNSGGGGSPSPWLIAILLGVVAARRVMRQAAQLNRI